MPYQDEWLIDQWVEHSKKLKARVKELEAYTRSIQTDMDKRHQAETSTLRAELSKWKPLIDAGKSYGKALDHGEDAAIDAEEFLTHAALEVATAK